MSLTSIMRRFRGPDPAQEEQVMRELHGLRRQNVQVAQSGSKVMATMAGMLQMMAEDDSGENQK